MDNNTYQVIGRHKEGIHDDQSNNRVELIVGGSTGMGKEIARRLVQEGASLVLLAREAKKLSKSQEELAAIGPVQTAELDLYDNAAVDRYISTLDADPRHFKYLVNAAGAFQPVQFLDHTKAAYDTYSRQRNSRESAQKSGC